MNIGRLVPQIVYYVYASMLSYTVILWLVIRSTSQYQQETLEIILAAFYAGQIGLPAGKLIRAQMTTMLTDSSRHVFMIRNVSLR